MDPKSVIRFASKFGHFALVIVRDGKFHFESYKYDNSGKAEKDPHIGGGYRDEIDAITVWRNFSLDNGYSRF